MLAQTGVPDIIMMIVLMGGLVMITSMVLVYCRWFYTDSAEAKRRQAETDRLKNRGY